MTAPPRARPAARRRGRPPPRPAAGPPATATIDAGPTPEADRDPVGLWHRDAVCRWARRERDRWQAMSRDDPARPAAGQAAHTALRSVAAVYGVRPADIGPCARCTTPHHRYGPGGRPLCPTCSPWISPLL
ncbi:hypothetical protein [Parafrankia sp. FMc2]|uniref:hypothetical protein n=1 Tax=Parafrankia sp. FMc2 TaxID=3233196 RepID=UPI0034D42DD3